MPGFFNLPNEIMLFILEKINAKDLANIAQVSKYFNQLANSPSLIKRKIDYLLANSSYKKPIADILKLFEQFNLRNIENELLLINNAHYANGIYDVLLTDFRRRERLILMSQENLSLILQGALYANSIAQSLYFLNEKSLLTMETKKLILQKARYMQPILVILKQFEKCGILTAENLTLIFQKARYSPSIVEALSDSRRKEFKIPIIKENVLLILKHANRAIDIVNALKILEDVEILADEHRLLIDQYCNDAVPLASSLVILYETKILTPENQKRLIDHLPYLQSFVNGVRHSDAALKNFLTQENFEFLLQHVEYIEYLTRGLRILYEAGILNSKNRLLLAQNGSHLKDFIDYLLFKNVNFLTQSNLEFIFQFGHSIPSLIEGISSLYEADILTPENRDFIASHPAQADELASLLIALHKVNLFNSENRIRITQNVLYIKDIVKGLGIESNDSFITHPWYEELITQENFEFIVQHKQYAGEIAAALRLLHENSGYTEFVSDEINLLTSENKALMSQYAQHASHIASALVTLSKLKILTPENHALIAQYAADMSGIASILNQLYVTRTEFGGNIHLITQNLGLIFQSGQSSKAVASIIKLLNDANRHFYKKALLQFKEMAHKAYQKDSQKRGYTHSDDDDDPYGESEDNYIADYISRCVDRTYWNNFVTTDNVKLILDQTQYAHDINVALQFYIEQTKQALTQEVFDQIVAQFIKPQEKTKLVL